MLGIGIRQPMMTVVGESDRRMPARGCAAMLLISFLLAVRLHAADLPQFRDTTITNSLKMGYQIVVADLNRDGRPDLIVVDERATDLAWYENPTWERHVLVRDVPRTINLDAY